jgi:hypothetical protein
MTRTRTALAAAVVVSLLALGPAAAQDCPDPGTTIESLLHCVHHAIEMGHVDAPGVSTSLSAKLGAAQAAADRGDTPAAANILGPSSTRWRPRRGCTSTPPTRNT